MLPIIISITFRVKSFKKIEKFIFDGSLIKIDKINEPTYQLRNQKKGNIMGKLPKSDPKIDDNWLDLKA